MIIFNYDETFDILEHRQTALGHRALAQGYAAAKVA